MHAYCGAYAYYYLIYPLDDPFIENRVQNHEMGVNLPVLRIVLYKWNSKVPPKTWGRFSEHSPPNYYTMSRPLFPKVP